MNHILIQYICGQSPETVGKAARSRMFSMLRQEKQTDDDSSAALCMADSSYVVCAVCMEENMCDSFINVLFNLCVELD